MQAGIDRDLEESDAKKSQAADQPPVPLQERSLAPEAGNRQRRQASRRYRPAPEGERRRRHDVAHCTAEYPIARPAQHAEGQQQIRVERRELGRAYGRKAAGGPAGRSLSASRRAVNPGMMAMQ